MHSDPYANSSIFDMNQKLELQIFQCKIKRQKEHGKTQDFLRGPYIGLLSHLKEWMIIKVSLKLYKNDSV